MSTFPAPRAITFFAGRGGSVSTAEIKTRMAAMFGDAEAEPEAATVAVSGEKTGRVLRSTPRHADPGEG